MVNLYFPIPAYIQQIKLTALTYGTKTFQGSQITNQVGRLPSVIRGQATWLRSHDSDVRWRPRQSTRVFPYLLLTFALYIFFLLFFHHLFSRHAQAICHFICHFMFTVSYSPVITILCNSSLQIRSVKVTYAHGPKRLMCTAVNAATLMSCRLNNAAKALLILVLIAISPSTSILYLSSI